MDRIKSCEPITGMTRRSFLAIGAGALSSGLLFATEADALSLNKDSTGSSEESASDLWEQAKEQALQEGAVIEYGALVVPDAKDSIRGSVTSNATKYYLTPPLPNYIHVVATYKVNNETPKRITQIYNSYVYFTTGTVSNGYYSRTIIDNGRTLAIYCSGIVTVQSTFNIGFEAYAEFYPSGANYIA